MVTDFSVWWEGLALLSKIYWIIAFPSTLIFLILLLVTIFGGDFDSDADLDVDAEIDLDHGIDFQFISFKNIVAFFTIFAWSGLACIEGGLSLVMILMISLVSGLIMMAVMAAIFYFMSKLSHSGTLDLNNAIGKTGRVYLTIPKRRSKNGKVQIEIQGGLRTLDAMTESSENISTGSTVEVIDIINNSILLVKRSR